MVCHTKSYAMESVGDHGLGRETHAPKALGMESHPLGDTNNDGKTDWNDSILHTNHMGSWKGDLDPEGHTSNGDTNKNGSTDVHDTLAAVI